MHDLYYFMHISVRMYVHNFFPLFFYAHFLILLPYLFTRLLPNRSEQNGNNNDDDSCLFY
jgi:hypothetical protein